MVFAVSPLRISTLRASSRTWGEGAPSVSQPVSCRVRGGSIMKRLAIVLLLTLPFSLVASRAFAAKPTIQRIPVDNEFVDSSCGFDVDIHQTGTIVDISYTDAEGVLHDFQAFPQGKQVMTNLDTGKTITVNIAGPGTFTVNPDGSFTLVGRGTWSWNSNLTRTGHLVDLCAELAA